MTTKEQKKQNLATSTYLSIAKISYFGLLAVVPFWHLVLHPPTLGINPYLITAIWFIPLLFPLKGILTNNPYTFAWCAFLALLYMIHSIVILFSSPTERMIARIELIFSQTFLMGNIYFAKYRGQELGLSIRQKKK